MLILTRHAVQHIQSGIAKQKSGGIAVIAAHVAIRKTCDRKLHRVIPGIPEHPPIELVFSDRRPRPAEAQNIACDCAHIEPSQVVR